MPKLLVVAVGSVLGAPQFAMYGGDEVSARRDGDRLVVDEMRYAGEDTPKCAAVAVAMGRQASSTDKAKKQYFVGSNAMAVRRDGMRVESPMTDGIVTDWDAAEALMEHSTRAASAPTRHHLLMAEPSFNTASAREKTAGSPSRSWRPRLLPLEERRARRLAAGRGTALVLDVGGGTTCAAAVHDGYVLGSHYKRRRSPATRSTS